jgi:glycolate oxidase FAD binding subunit
MTPVAERLRQLLGADAIAAGEAARADFAVDAAQPAAVAYPAAPEQVAALLAVAVEQRWGVIPWGGGSGMGRGNPPVRYDVALSLSRLAQLADHDADNLTLTAGAGLTVAEANRRIGASHQMLAIAFRDAAHTLGGCVAANLTAPRRLLYGEVRDQLLSVGVALPDGNVVRYGRKVLKNVAGYDMNKLFLGSQGLLGVVVETTFKLYAVPDEQRCLLAPFAALPQATACAAALYRSQLLPAFIRLLDAPAAAQAGTALPAAAAAPGRPLFLLVGFEGRASTLQRQLRDARALFAQHGADAPLELEEVSAALREVLEGHGAAPGVPAAVRLRLGTVPTALPGLLARLEGALGTPLAAVTDYAAGQIAVALGAAALDTAALGNGDPGAAPGRPRSALAARILTLRRELAAERGYLVLEEAPPALKEDVDALGADPGETRLMRMLKARFDPADVLAPGRYFDLEA